MTQTRAPPYTASARSVALAYPLVKNWLELEKQIGLDTMLKRLVETAPAELFVFTRRDLDAADLKVGNDHLPEGAAKIKRGEPFLRMGGQLLALDGTYLDVDPAEIASSAPSVLIPERVRPGRPVESVDEARKSAGPEDAALLTAYDKKVERFVSCSERVWKSVAGDLPAGFDLLIIRGTRTTSVRSKADEAVWTRCGGDANEKLQTDTLEKLKASREVRRGKALQTFGAMVRQRLNPAH